MPCTKTYHRKLLLMTTRSVSIRIKSQCLSCGMEILILIWMYWITVYCRQSAFFVQSNKCIVLWVFRIHQITGQSNPVPCKQVKISYQTLFDLQNKEFVVLWKMDTCKMWNLELEVPSNTFACQTIHNSYPKYNVLSIVTSIS